ncbi:DNA methyltransferase [Actinomadura sp. SCN-SB]|uniref:DNA methyltransferase n=1 Tax=Actinomadura sp. SCN-SB TaxID=3373092 RepID=UPI0037501AD8
MHHAPSNPNDPGDSHPKSTDTADRSRRMLPLTVWLCSDHSAQANDDKPSTTRAPHRTSPHNPQICARHRQAVGHQLARHLISLCTREGDVVAEAFTTSEATLVAATDLNRRGLALVPHFPLAQHIGSRLRATLPEDRLGQVAMRPCRPDQMARGLADHLGEVGMVIAAPPPYETGGGIPKRVVERSCPACRADLWMLSHEQLGLFLTAAWKVLRPGGVLALITTARHENNRLIDPAPRLIRLAQGLGFRYAQHVIALRVPIEGDSLVVQAGPADLAELRNAGSRALPPAVSVHADVCLLLKPQSGGAR